MTELREDGFLGGRLRIRQPTRGYRAGADAVMLAAACPARAGESVLELGCGAGAAILCLGARVPGLRLAGLELQPAYAELAAQNATANGFALEVHQGDLAQMPTALRSQSFDHVIANPPYFTDGTLAPDAGRSRARHEETPLGLWIAAGLRRLQPGGWITLIQRADRLAVILSALGAAAGAITVLPVAAREGREAGRVIVLARKGARAPLRLLPPFVMHAKPLHSADEEDLTEAAQAVLRGGAALSLGAPNFR
ncbi:methyltransferase domain-containing protein [Paracoccus kondratievae]|uniref:tRNA1(Val) (adenine(37)-N6)-methyltransferase n=1 Tax=Paracoccus kondratievae TaxID=135740 RepID=UPI0012662AD0|nr:methyltransferase domain-containing protein [Paracoccus kondratievae]QFQ86545.1 methyltransferase domain-containing protein [Paracoccus kondratievae]